MKNRNSSLELLRIISMFFIIMHHYSVHGGYETLSYNNFSTSTVFIQILSIFGKIGCQIFALISGYFLITSDLKNNTKKIIKLITQLYFYSLIILFIVDIFDLIPLTTIDIIKSILPIIYDNWYIINYILLLLLVPYLNNIILNLSKDNFKKLIIIVFFTWSIIPILTDYSYILDSWSFSNLDFFIVMYLIGSYIKLHYQSERKNNVNLLVSISFSIILIFLTLIIDYIGYKSHNNHLFNYALGLSQLNSPITLICSIYIFIYCTKIKSNSKIINTISSTTLGIYLLHDNILMRKYIWQYISPNINYIHFPYIHAIIKIIIIFIVCSIIEYIRIITFKKIDIWIYNKANIIYNTLTKKIQKKKLHYLKQK